MRQVRAIVSNTGVGIGARRVARLLSAVVAAAALLGSGPIANAQSGQRDFFLIASSTDLILAQGRQFGTPAINESGVVGFTAALADGRLVVFAASAPGTVEADFDTVMATGTMVAGQSLVNLFGDFGAIDAGGGHFAVHAALADGFQRILTAEDSDADGSYDVTVRVSQADGAFRASPFPSVNEFGEVGFRRDVGTCGGSGSMSRSSGSGTEFTICPDTGPVGGINGNPAPDLNAAGDLLFWGRQPNDDPSDPLANATTLFRGTATVDVGDSQHGTHNLDTFSFPAINDDGTAIYLGQRKSSGAREVLTSSGGTPTVVASTATNGFGGFSRYLALNDSDTPAFLACELSNGCNLQLTQTSLGGLYTGGDPLNDAVIEIGDSLFGSAVTGIRFSRAGLNNADQITFWATLADGRNVIVRADPPAPPPIQWENAAGGVWSDPANWEGGTLPDERVDISADGTYTITTPPPTPLQSVRVGNSTGVITLVPAGLFETDVLTIDGAVILRDGVFDVSFARPAPVLDPFALGLSPGARLTLDFDVRILTGLDIVHPHLVGDPLPPEPGGLVLIGTDEELTITAGSFIVASRVGVGGTANSVGSLIQIRDPGSRIETRELFGPQLDDGTFNFLIETGGELRVGDSLELAVAPGSFAGGLVTAGSSILGLRGDLLGDSGPLEFVLGGAGTADLTVAGGRVLLGQVLVLGEQASGEGSLTVEAGGGVLASPEQQTEIIVGDLGRGRLTFNTGSFFEFLGLDEDLPILRAGMQAGGSGSVDFVGVGDLANELRFDGIDVGVGGEGRLVVSETNLRTTFFGMGIEPGSSGLLVLDSNASLEVLLGAAIGPRGNAGAQLFPGTKLTIRNEIPGFPVVAAIGTHQTGGVGLLQASGAETTFDIVLIGANSQQPAAPFLGRNFAGNLELDEGALLVAREVVVGNQGRVLIDGGDAAIESLQLAPPVLDFPLAVLPDPGPGARVFLTGQSTVDVSGVIEIGTGGVPGVVTGTPLLLVTEGADVMAGGLDARGLANVRIFDGTVEMTGPVQIGRDASALPTTDAFVLVEGVNAVLDARTTAIDIGSDDPTCPCTGALVIRDGGEVHASATIVRASGTLSGDGRLVSSVIVLPGAVVLPLLGTSASLATSSAGGALAFAAAQAGTAAPPPVGTLTIDGDATFEAGSRLGIEVGGAMPGMHGALNVTGNLTFDGALTLTFVDGFAPSASDQFQFIQAAGTTTLAIESVAIENLAPGFDFDLAQNGDTLTLTALNDGIFVPEPTSIQLGLACLAMLGAVSRRRRKRNFAGPRDASPFAS